MKSRFEQLTKKLTIGKVLAKSEQKNTIGGYGLSYFYTGPGVMECTYRYYYSPANFFDFKLFGMTYYNGGKKQTPVSSCPIDAFSWCNAHIEQDIVPIDRVTYSGKETQYAVCSH